jgi:5-methylcytosine-specific restriction protein A
VSQHRIAPNRRWVSLASLPKGPNGRALCRWCNQEVPKGKRSFCSDACVHEHKIRTNPGYVREQLWERDQGVCAACGFDLKQFKATWGNHFHEIRALPQHRWKAVEEIMSELLDRMGQQYGRRDLPIWPGETLWNADHILEVVNGGGECGLENYQTLCIPCHKAKTRQMHQARREARK